MKNEPHYFGVRHLSPCGAYELIKFLDNKNPDVVLIEGPSDLSDMINDIADSRAVPPFAIMAYTSTVPIQTILYPMAVYSPEYQAILWAKRNNKECRFIDLPSGVFLSLTRAVSEKEESVPEKSVYDRMEEIIGQPQETWWERFFEHNTDEDAYRENILVYGRELRESDDKEDFDAAENHVRECYMKKQIEKAVSEFSAEKTVVVTGAYHTEGIKSCKSLTEREIKKLPSENALSTLMPYSYYRLSSRSGYGAGNKAPAYYELIWNALCNGDAEEAVYRYVGGIARYQREKGGITSSAEVIETIRLAKTLSAMRGSEIPVLADLRDSIITCIGHGHFSEVAKAVAYNEIGTKIGSLPEGISRTALQDDFYRQLEELKLEKCRTNESVDISLDLRENLRVKTEKSAFLDLHRSFFLNRLKVLGIDFGKNLNTTQAKATWKEEWVLRWTPEAEIQIVEASLKGNTIEFATAFALNERLNVAATINDVTSVIETACLCGLEKSVRQSVGALQSLTVDAASFPEIAVAAENLSDAIKYGSIRKLNTDDFIPVLKQLFFRGCLIMINSCKCDNDAVRDIIPAIEKLNHIDIDNNFINSTEWIKVLKEASVHDDINTKASGFTEAILLERGLLNSDELSKEVSRRLSKGMPADLGAAWFEGLSMKNHYALITRLSLWQYLSEYIDSLDDTEFRRALVFLRRAFCSFSAGEKDQIAENLGEIWGVNAQQVSEIVNDIITEEQQEVIDSLDDFDFDDL